MDREEEVMRIFIRNEKKLQRDETRLMMKAEEGMKRFYQYTKILESEAGLKTEAIDKAIKEAYQITQMKKFMTAQKLLAQK
jgi:hypothetical protein